MEEIQRFLLLHPPFKELPRDQIQRMARAIEVAHYQAGQDIFVYGSRPLTYLYIIRQGVVNLLREDAQGSTVVDSLGEGEFLATPR